MAGLRAGLLLVLVLASVTNTLALSDAYFWHITDMHYDPFYQNASDPSNSCNVYRSAGERGMYGNFRCDAPWELMKSAVEHGIMQNHDGIQPKFILWTGDSMPHSQDRTWITQESVLKQMKEMTTLMKDNFGDIPVIPVLGNHDIHPKNQFSAGTYNDYYAKIGDMWDGWLDSTDRITFDSGAYYSKTINGLDGLRIIVLNTNLFYIDDDAESGDDPGGMLEWAQQMLDQARSNGEQVYIMFHVTPGISANTGQLEEFEKPYNHRFNKLVNENADVIQGMFSGHEHYDGFKLWFDEVTWEPTAYLLVAPAVTPWSTGGSGGVYSQAHNPAIRKLWMDRDMDYMIKDFTQYYLDLDMANMNQYADWEKEYSFNDVYGTNMVTPKELANLVSDWAESKSSTFADYYKYRTVSVEDDRECGCACRFRHICSIKHVSKPWNDICLSRALTTTCGAEMMGVSTMLLFTMAVLMKIIIT